MGNAQSTPMTKQERDKLFKTLWDVADLLRAPLSFNKDILER